MSSILHCLRPAASVVESTDSPLPNPATPSSSSPSMASPQPTAASATKLEPRTLKKCAYFIGLAPKVPPCGAAFFPHSAEPQARLRDLSEMRIAALKSSLRRALSILDFRRFPAWQRWEPNLATGRGKAKGYGSWRVGAQKKAPPAASLATRSDDGSTVHTGYGALASWPPLGGRAVRRVRLGHEVRLDARFVERSPRFARGTKRCARGRAGRRRGRD